MESKKQEPAKKKNHMNKTEFQSDFIKSELNKAKFQIDFIKSELDKVIELIGESHQYAAKKLKKIKGML